MPVTLYTLTGIGLLILGLYSLIVQAHLIRKIMLLTGIVVAIAATALALTLVLRVQAETGRTDLPEDMPERP